MVVNIGDISHRVSHIFMHCEQDCEEWDHLNLFGVQVFGDPSLQFPPNFLICFNISYLHLFPRTPQGTKYHGEGDHHVQHHHHPKTPLSPTPSSTPPTHSSTHSPPSHTRKPDDQLFGDQVDFRMYLYSKYIVSTSQDLAILFIVEKSSSKKINVLRINQFPTKFQNMSICDVKFILVDNIFKFVETGFRPGIMQQWEKGLGKRQIQQKQHAVFKNLITLIIALSIHKCNEVILSFAPSRFRWTSRTNT